MRLNEKIGIVFIVIMLASLLTFVLIHNWVFFWIFLIGLFGQLIFLSIWGLTTFNDKFEK